MKLLFTILVASLLIVTSLPEAQAAQSESRKQLATKQKLKQKQTKKRVISKRNAIMAAQSQVKGKVLSATLIKSRGPAVFRVKMLVSDKRVRTVFVDGNNGRVIRIN